MIHIKSKHIFLIYSIMLLIIFSTIAIFLVNKNNLQSISRDYTDFSDGWLAEDGTTADFSDISGMRTYSATLPTLREDDVLYFNAKTLNVSVYIADKCVYQSSKFSPNFFGYTAGSEFVHIPFEVSDSGKQITLVLDNPYSDGSGKITRIQLGNSADLLTNSIIERLFSLCISMLIIFIGIIFIALFIPVWRKHSFGKELLYFGLFAFNIGVFMLTDSKLLQELFQNAHIFHVISEMFMLLIIVPMFLFLESMYYKHGIHSKVILCICELSIIVFAVSYPLAITATMDYHQTIRLTHITYGVAILSLIILNIKDFIAKKQLFKYHLIGVASIATGAVFDVVLWGLTSRMDTSLFTRLGTLLFMCFEAAQVVSGFLAEYRSGIRSRILENLAYHDGLTGLLNRTSYIEEIERLSNDLSSNILFAFFDINYLKQINDSHGHLAGDKLIVIISSTIRNCCGHLGKCYRIGGDEFVVITEGPDLEISFSSAISRMEEELHKINDMQTFPFPVSVACGYAVWNDKSKSINDVIQEADQKMYSNKKIMKAKQQ